MTVRPRHQGGAHAGRAPAKIVRVPAKITGLIMFHLDCQIKILVSLGIFGIKKSEKTKWQPSIPWRLEYRRLSHTHSYPACHKPEMHCMSTYSVFAEASMLGHGAGIGYTGPGPRMGPMDNFSLVTGP